MKFDLISIVIITLIIAIVYFAYNNETDNKTHNETHNETFSCPIVTNQSQCVINTPTNRPTNIPANKIETYKNVKKIPTKKLKPQKSAMKKKTKNSKQGHKKKVKFAIQNNTDNFDDLVFMDIGTNNKYYGKIVIKLFSDVVPKTCDNFRELCKTKKYNNSPFHRIIKDFMIQGGDFTNGNGTGGMSIYGKKFPDENFDLTHNRKYLLSMANSGPNSNGSQFFITTNPAPHLNNHHVVFGEIYSGFDVIDDLNDVNTDNSNKPFDNIKVLNCGIYNGSK